MLSVFLIGAALAQSPEEGWKTLETDHFKLHYPADTEEWALYAGARLDAIRAIVSEEVGYSPPQQVQIVVMDPFAQANGFALPLLGSPRMGVFPTAPDPASGIGHYRSWSEDLIVHEDAHLVHLLRPSRNVGLDLALRYLGIGPVSLNSPAWVIEGYATVVEGRLTGLGRPNSNARAAFLRGLALDGTFPAYGDLDLPDRYAAGAYRYLVGSAYLEWLVARSHPDALRDLWARMTAVEIRNFDEAFEGVFGDDPETLYNRFVAELTYESLAAEHYRPHDPATLFQDFDGYVAPPAVSPDGSKLLLLRRDDGPARFEVYPTDPGDTPRETWEEDNLPDLEEDPEDVEPIRPAAYPIEPAEERVLGGRRVSGGRWIDDDTVLFTEFLAGPNGDAYPELFAWTISTNETRRVTRRGDVRDAAPHGESAYALQTRSGLSALVRVDLADGTVTPLMPASAEHVVAQPRVSSDGTKLAWVANRGAGWTLEWAPLEAGALGDISVVPLPEGAEVLTVDWSPDGRLLATLGRGGFMEAYLLPLSGGDWQQLTHSRTGAMYPTMVPDGSSVFYLVGDDEGLDLHRLAVADAVPGEVDDAELRTLLRAETSVLRPPIPEPAPLLETEPVEGQRYRARPQVRPMIGEVLAPDQDNLELGVSAVDIVGRNELVAFASLGDRMLIGDDGGFGFRGARLAYTSRRWPVRIRGDLGYLDFNGLTPQWVGVLHGAYSRQWTHGGMYSRLGAVSVTDFIEVSARAEGQASATHRLWLGPAWLGAGLDARGQVEFVDTGELTWRGTGGLGGGTASFGLLAELELGSSADGFVLGGRQRAAPGRPGGDEQRLGAGAGLRRSDPGQRPAALPARRDIERDRAVWRAAHPPNGHHAQLHPRGAVGQRAGALAAAGGHAGAVARRGPELPAGDPRGLGGRPLPERRGMERLVEPAAPPRP